MFPRGWPGIGLLMLRLSITIALLGDGYSQHPTLSGWIRATVTLLCLTLSAGYLTPLAATMALLSHAFIWARFGVGSTFYGAVICLNSISLAVLGPGGYSVDATLFGRRLLI
jgi:uncharacterized membrane protein YphA (DoxX/SURF4 family)